MPSQFEYSGADRSGRPIKGVFEGDNPMSVVLKLKSAGVTVYSIKKKAAEGRAGLQIGKKIGTADLIAFNSQLASLLKTKLPLSDSLRHLAKELKGSHLKSALEEVAAGIESGRDLTESLSMQGGYFPPLYVSMVEAGEKSGNLAEVLFQTSRYFQSGEDFRRKVVHILLYPAALTVLAGGVLIFLLKVMVPPYIDMYSGFHVDFPLSLRLVVQLEQFFSPNLFWKVFAPGGLIALIVLVRAARRNETMRASLDRLVLRIPLWGKMTRDAILARSFATLAILLRSGVPLLESLNIVKNLISNRPLRDAFESGASEVLEGELFSQTLIKQPLFPVDIAWSVRNGEIAGDLPDSIERAERVCRSKFEYASKVILSTLEPALLIAIGAIIVSIAASLFYPLYSLSKYLQG